MGSLNAESDGYPRSMRNPLQPFIGELEMREARLTGTIEKLEQAEIDPGYSDVLEAEIDELYAEMLYLEDRLGGLHAAVVAAVDPTRVN